jgi:hypothetical protein
MFLSVVLLIQHYGFIKLREKRCEMCLLCTLEVTGKTIVYVNNNQLQIIIPQTIIIIDWRLWCSSCLHLECRPHVAGSVLVLENGRVLALSELLQKLGNWSL